MRSLRSHVPVHPEAVGWAWVVRVVINITDNVLYVTLASIIFGHIMYLSKGHTLQMALGLTYFSSSKTEMAVKTFNTISKKRSIFMKGCKMHYGCE